MSMLFRIVYAAHANGTHHKLALDALQSLQVEKSDAWMRLFLKHAELYMVGAKDPDNTFKDFKNHVLHVGDAYWGGAPEQTVVWYGKTVAALKEQRWADAVYAAGVTSHYYTDPIHPFHTGQTEAENAIHRAAEWSISRSYNDLRALGLERYPVLAVPAHTGPDWLKSMVCDGAEFSHRYYEKLIAHYDIHRGVTDPPAGLDGVARGIVAELLIYAATGFARILERAIAEAAVAPPHVDLGLDTIMATIKIPAKALAKRLSNVEDRKVVEAMYDELKATGRVDKALPEDDRMVRDLYAKEVLGAKLAKQSTERSARLKVAQPAIVKTAPAAVVAPVKPVVATVSAVTPAAPVSPVQKIDVLPKPLVAPPVAPSPFVQAAVQVAAVATAASPKSQVGAPPAPAAAKPAAAGPFAALAELRATMPDVKPVQTSVPSIKPASGERERRFYLSEADNLEAAPSIGPKMAERFASLGIKTVGQFLDLSPDSISARLADRRLDADLIETWQYQALLVMEIPGLRGTHAQLLTGAGYKTVDEIASADPVKLSADVLLFAATTDGKRVLRDGEPPDIEKIKGWVTWATEARAA
jgi:predicted flap endonuclease-1-like 5' DNA nuclease